MITNFNIKDITDDNIVNKRILIRVDFNVDIDKNGKIVDDFRILKAIPTIKYLLAQNNRLILITHLGKPKRRDKKYGLKPIALRLKQLITDKDVVLINDFFNENDKNKITNQALNQIILLENIRFYQQEMDNDINFAEKLSELADIYVNEAFSESHRKVASIDVINSFLPGYAGLLLKNEVEKLNQIFTQKQKPLTFIVGGAKISTKIKFIQKITHYADFLLLAGEVANTFLSIAGLPIVNDLEKSASIDVGYDSQVTDIANNIWNHQDKSHCQIILPLDGFAASINNIDAISIQDIDKIKEKSDIFDIGPKTINKFQEIIIKSKIVVWNGPLGWIEKKQFCQGTKSIYKTLTDNPRIFSIIGGGDSISYLRKLGQIDKISHWSTGGGAMLEFIEKRTLPGLEALEKY